jgi:hypothetical protein
VFVGLFSKALEFLTNDACRVMEPVIKWVHFVLPTSISWFTFVEQFDSDVCYSVHLSFKPCSDWSIRTPMLSNYSTCLSRISPLSRWCIIRYCRINSNFELVLYDTWLSSSPQAGIGTYTIPHWATSLMATISKTVDMMYGGHLDAHVMGRSTICVLLPPTNFKQPDTSFSCRIVS